MDIRYAGSLVRTGEMITFIVSRTFNDKIVAGSYERKKSDLNLMLMSDVDVLEEISSFLSRKFNVSSIVREKDILIVLNNNVGLTMVKVSNYFRRMSGSHLNERKIKEIVLSVLPVITPPNFSKINLSQEGIIECAQYICSIVSNEEKFQSLNPVIKNDILELSKKIKKFVL